MAGIQRQTPGSASISAHLADESTPSPTLSINERVQALWADGKRVFHLGFGESRFPVHPTLFAALRRSAHHNRYLPVQGLAALRQAIAAYQSRVLGIPLSPEQVIVGPGSKALHFALLMALDGVLLLPTPSWVSYAPQARMLGKQVHFIEGTAVDGYALCIEALDKAVRQARGHPKILLINSPNNPTGRMLSSRFLQTLAAFCRQHSIIAISDEIYAQVTHELVPHDSLARYYPEGTVVTSGLSKHLSLGGWRLGLATIPEEMPELMAALRTIASEIWSAPAAPVQYAAVAAFQNDKDIERYIRECAQIHAVRTQHFWHMLNELGIVCPQPQGGFYMMPNFDRWREPLAQQSVHTSIDLAAYLLANYQIASLPGTAFGVPASELSLRLATSYLDMETDERAEAILAAWRQDGGTDAFIERHHTQMKQALDRFRQFIEDLTAA